MEGFAIYLMCLVLFFKLRISKTTDTITPGQSMRANETLVSKDGSFELGFFSPGNGGKWYLGIWYKKIPVRTVAWVANREIPIVNSSGILNLTDQGTLVLWNCSDHIVWSSDDSGASRNPVAKLWDSGNLVVTDVDNPDNILWQSFDHPGNTLLAGMKLGRNLITGREWSLTSWKSIDDPAPGDFSCRIDTNGFPQLVIMKGATKHCRGGSWNGLGFTGMPALRQNQVFDFHFVLNDNEVYYEYDLEDKPVVTRLAINRSGPLQRYYWVDRTEIWRLYFSLEMDHCDNYAVCGAYGNCNVENSPFCACLEGFTPKNPEEWSLLDWSKGCVRKSPLDCTAGDGFLKHTGVKLPDTSFSWYNARLSLKECEQICLQNCSCTGYANMDIRDGGSGCLLWFGDLIDIREFRDGGQDLYVRLAAIELDHIPIKGGSNEEKKVAIIVSCLTLVMLLEILVMILFVRKKNQKLQGMRKDNEKKDCDDEVKEDMELPTFDMATIEIATQDFSRCNKLGEGGFGPVYKGTLIDGQEIAVKRLSKSSRQGLKEFKNEVMLMSKLQHRNLVKLLGCCIQEEERMLVYEFLPNKSLDYFIFDQTRSGFLDWQTRFQIISGVARGLLYLHHDSRLRIIHRDLKASNILLDRDMNPKISDFGIARTFVGDESESNTNRVVGTYGYMSPEYAMDGLVSVKSDIFSLGILTLEIISGVRNRGFYHPDHRLNLPGHAWRLWVEDRPLELVDEFLLEPSTLPQLLRCIHVGLLCAQQLPEDRPNMPTAVMMLGSEIPLPQPKQPGFYTERNPLEANYLSSGHVICSVNEITDTLLEAR